MVWGPFHRQYGNGLPDPSLWFQSFLYEIHRPQQRHHVRYLPLDYSLRSASGPLLGNTHDISADCSLAA